VHYKSVQDARNTLESLNENIDESTLIRHGLNQFKEHIDLKADTKAWKKLTRTEKTWKKFKSLFTKAINNNKCDTGTLKAIGIANAVKEQVNQNKENQRVFAQATVEANDKINNWKSNRRNYMQPARSRSNLFFLNARVSFFFCRGGAQYLLIAQKSLKFLRIEYKIITSS
jgi:hypothetical protein